MRKPVRIAGPSCPNGIDCPDRYDFGDGQVLLVGRLVAHGEGRALVRLPGSLLPGGDGTRNGPEIGVTGQIVADGRRARMAIGRGEEAIVADLAELAAAEGASHAGR